MFLRLLILFVTVPLVELYLLLQLASVTSAGATFLLVIVTGIIGSMLAKREGVLAWRKFQSAVGEARVPSREIQDGLMIVFAAALLLTPGLLTDAVGFLLLVPAGRSLIRKHVLSKLFRGFGGSFRVETSGFENNRDSESNASSFEDFPEFPLDPSRFNDRMTVDGKATRR